MGDRVPPLSVLSRLRRALGLPDWQPIHTAPMGRPILVWNGYVGSYSTEGTVIRGTREFPLGFEGGTFGHHYPVPILWAELPRPSRRRISAGWAIYQAMQKVRL